MQHKGLLGVGGMAALAMILLWSLRESGPPSSIDARTSTVPAATPNKTAPLEELAPIPASESRSVESAGAQLPDSSGPPPEETERVQATTIIRARLVDEQGTPLRRGELRSLKVNGDTTSFNLSAAVNEVGVVNLEIPDRSLRALSGSILPMTFGASAEDRVTVFVTEAPARHEVSDLGDIVLAPGGTLTGTVVDDQGQPIEGADVLASSATVASDMATLRFSGPPPGAARPWVETGAGGTFSCSGIPIADTQLWAFAEGHLWTRTPTFDLSASPFADVGEIVLIPVPDSQIIRGIVRQPDGAGCGGATVSFNSNDFAQRGSLITHEDGTFDLFPAGVGAIDVVAHAPGDAFGMSALHSAQPGERIELQLTDHPSLDVYVQDEDGAPIEGAQVGPFVPLGGIDPVDGSRRDPLEGPLLLLPGVDWAITNAAGLAEVSRPAEEFILTAQRAGYRMKRVGSFEPTDSLEEVRIELIRKPMITGRVVSYGKPLAGASVTVWDRPSGFPTLEQGFALRLMWCDGPAVLSDENGNFSVSVQPGWTSVSVIARADDLAAGELALELEAGHGADEATVEMTTGGGVRGTLTPPTGTLANTMVIGASRGDAEPLWMRPDAEGSYEFKNLTPGPWRIEARSEQPAPGTISFAQTPEERDFRWNCDVIDGETSTLDLDLSVEGRVELRGQLLIDGVAPKGWTASLAEAIPGQAPRDLPAVDIDAGGTFVLACPSGTYTLTLAGEMADSERLTVLRRVTIAGPHSDWTENLATGEVDVNVDPGIDEVRLFHGRVADGEGEHVTFSVGPGGRVTGRSPVGDLIIRRQAVVDRAATEWVYVGKVTVR